jgi:hypothetical protein
MCACQSVCHILYLSNRKCLNNGNVYFYVYLIRTKLLCAKMVCST